MQELAGDLARQVLAVMCADQLQHHVERGGGAGAVEDAAVDHEQVVAQSNIREGFSEAVGIVPMHGAAPVGQQPRAPARSCLC